MKHIPTQKDAAADLYRCVYFTLEKDGFKSENFSRFLSNALKIIEKLNTPTVTKAKELIAKALDEKREKSKRQEDLLTASQILR